MQQTFTVLLGTLLSFNLVGCFDQEVREETNTITEGILEGRANGLSLMEQGRYEEAIKVFQGILSQDPDYDTCYVSIGRCYAMLQKKDLAIKYFDSAIQVNPNYSKAYSMIGNSLKDDAEALRYLSKGLEVARSPQEKSSAHYYFARYYEKRENLKQATTYFQLADSISPLEKSQKGGYASFLYKSGEVEEALLLFKELSLKYPENRRYQSELIKCQQSLDLEDGNNRNSEHR